MANQDIRNEILGSGLKLWIVAEKMGLRDDTFSRKLRKELSTEEKALYFLFMKIQYLFIAILQV